MNELFLSKVLIDASRCPTGSYPYNLRKAHGFIYSLFGDLSGTRVLWSDDSERLRNAQRSDYSKMFMVLSPSLPSLPASKATWCHIDTLPIEERFLSHPVYAFSLKACCTRNVSSQQKQADAKADRRKVAITDPEELTGWLTRQFNRGGCSLLRHELIGRTALQIRHTPDEQKTITLNCCTFRGVFRVEERKAFISLFTGGIGRGKAYGLGLLQIAPVSDFTNED